MQHQNHSLIRSLPALLLLSLFAQPAAAEGLLWDLNKYEPIQAAMMNPKGALVYSKEKRNWSHTRWVLKGSGENDWTEDFEILNTTPKNEPKTVQLWYEQFKTAESASCAGEWVMIEESAQSMIFEHRRPECPPESRATSLYRVLYGKFNVFKMSAIVKGEMSDATRQALLEMLASATISE